MPRFIPAHLYRYFVVVALTLLPFANACADFTYIENTTGRSDFIGRLNYQQTPAQPQVPANLIPTANGYWIAGTIDGIASLVSFQNNGAPLVTRYVGYNEGSILAAAASDGGVFALANHSGILMQPLCSLSRIGADGNLRWNVQLNGFCGQFLGADGSDASWIFIQNDVYHVAPDGSAAHPIDAPIAATDALAVNTTGAGLYRASGAPFSATPTGASIERVAANGTSQVLWHDDENLVAIDHLSVGADSNVYAIGHDQANEYVIFSIAPQGTLRWTRTFANSLVDTVDYVSLSDSAIAVLTDSGSLFTIKADGTNGPSTSLPSAGRCDDIYDGHCLQAAPNGELLVLFSADANNFHLYRYLADGSLLSSQGFQSIPPVSMAALSDASVLISINTNSVANPLAFVHSTRDAKPAATPQTQKIIATGSELVDAATAADGSTYLLTQPYLFTQVKTQYALTHLAADGSVAWQQMFSGALDYSYAKLALGSDRICAGNTGISSVQLACYSIVSGQLLWSYAGASINDLMLAWRLLDDGSVAIVENPQDFSSPSQYVLIDASGNPAAAKSLPQHFQNVYIGIGGAGTTVISDLGISHRTYGYDRSGNSLYASFAPVTSSNPIEETVTVAADGTAVISGFLGQSSDGTAGEYLWALSNTGAIVWTKRLQPAGSVTSIRIDDSRIYVSHADFSHGIGQFSAQAYSLADGSLLWQTPVFGDANNSNFIFGTSHAPEKLVLSGFSSTQHLNEALILDATSGQINRDILQACDASSCLTQPVTSLSADATLRMAVSVVDPREGIHAYMYAISHATQPAAGIRVDQAGLDGVWYAPYASGDGFTLDYIASANTLFIPWFTHALVSSNAPYNASTLAWYYLQGTVTPGATDIGMPIYTSALGSFNTGKVASTAIGSAHLSFIDCNHGSIQYQFNTAAVGGTIQLSRLTPQTRPCVLADGSIEAPAINSAPAQGFDARQSGSWYDPGKSGQGIELTVVPSNSSNPGLLFGAWYTFDPSGNANDAKQQHWFTLQGDLSQASAGKIVIPILQTVGLAPTRNTYRVGLATWTMIGCDQAHLDYLFDASEVAGSFSGLAGSIDLTKIGGCSASP